MMTRIGRMVSLGMALLSLLVFVAGCGSSSSSGTYSISGTVSGTATAGVTMTLSGAASAITTTDSSGNYSFTGLANGSYTVTPSRTGYTFNPATSSSTTVNGANVTGVNFVATAGASAPVGSLSLDITDAPGLAFDRVLITVKSIWFHTDSNVGTETTGSGWVKKDLTAPVTIDLAQLSNGKMHSDVGGAGKALFDGLSLPTGNYQQIRLFLASSADALTASATSSALKWNNQVDIKDSSGNTTSYPLNIPGHDHGIKVIPETPIKVTTTTPVKLALDFNIGRDVVKHELGRGSFEFTLKPTLGYYDMGRVGAITGNILTASGTTVFANYTGKNFVIKAERPRFNTYTSNNYRVVYRTTTIDSAGKFTFYPLPVFSNSTSSYDIVIRGRNVETFIVKKVLVTRGTTPAGSPTSVGPAFSMVTGKEYAVNVNVNPTGAWVNFYQTLPTDPVPYEIRWRHVNPYTGSFYHNIELSSGPLHAGTYNNGGVINFTSVTPKEGLGAFTAYAKAPFFKSGAPTAGNPITTATTGIPFGTLAVDTSTGAKAHTVSGKIIPPAGLTTMNKGYVLVIHGGTIIDKIDASSLMKGGGTYSISPLPGERKDSYYNLFAIGWDSANPKTGRAAGSLPHVDLTGKADVTNADITLTTFKNTN